MKSVEKDSPRLDNKCLIFSLFIFIFTVVMLKVFLFVVSTEIKQPAKQNA